jgi:predicted ATP-grasp superfamily ATP-dependent carboligase
MKRVLVTGAGGSAAANFVHSLRLAGEPFYVVGTDASRYHLELADVDARYLLPRVDDDEYLPSLNALVETEEIELVHAQPDPEVLFLARFRDDVSARTYLPSTEAIELCQDKLGLVERLREADLPVPECHGARSAESLRESTKAILESHERVWVRARRGAGARASLPVTTADQAVAWARWWIEVRGLVWDDFMVTEFLPGRELGWQGLWRDGELVTSQARERLEYVFGNLVPSGQTSSPSVARTVHRSDVNELAIATVRAVDAHATGVFGVDLKENAKGIPLVTEINAGRFFTTSNFLAAAGVNIPSLYVKLAYGEQLPDVAPVNAAPDGLLWIRAIDMGYTLVREGEWTSRSATPTTLSAGDNR